MDPPLEELRDAVVEVEGAREVWRAASRATTLRRRCVEAIRRIEHRDGRGSVRYRRAAVRLEALSTALTEALRVRGAEGLARNEERARLIEWADADDSRETTSSLARTRDMLAAGLEQIAEAHAAVEQDEAALRGVETYHKRIGDAMRRARRLVRAITRRDQRDKLAMAAALAFFYLVVAYILFKRLPLKSIILAVTRATLRLLAAPFRADSAEPPPLPQGPPPPPLLDDHGEL